MNEPADVTETFYFERQALIPTAATWFRHGLLLLLTIVTATIAGSIYPFGRLPFMVGPDPETWADVADLLYQLPYSYLSVVVNTVYLLATDWELLKDGLSFSLSLLFILTSHEMGHYIACRIYRVDATLPYFLPTPPMIGPAGTFGAFIRILSPFPSRKAVFDIGIAGPIAGFVALIPIAIIGLMTMETAIPQQVGQGGTLVFADPLLIRIVAMILGQDLTFGIGNAFYFAAWVGLLVTALNLIPSGQLDGGHAIYAIFGERVHYWTGRIAFAVMATLSVIGLVYFNSPSGFLIAILLGIMMRIRHPEPWDDAPLDAKRRLLAVVTLAIFVLSFVPFPIKIG